MILANKPPLPRQRYVLRGYKYYIKTLASSQLLLRAWGKK